MNPERTDPTEFVFPEGHLKALTPGETGSVSKSDARESIINKSQNFDQRIQQLIDDVSFLFNTNEIKHPGWLPNGISDVDTRDEAGDWDVWDSPLLRSDERHFGSALAQCARPFVEENEDYTADEIVWGFIIGLVSESIEEFESEEQSINEIIDSLEEYTTRRREWALQKNEINQETNLRREAIQAIENLGVLPTKTLARAGRWLSYEWEQELELEWQGFDSYELHEYNIENFEKIWENVLSDLRSEHAELSQVIELRKSLDSDYERLDQQGWNTIRPIDVVRSISQRGGNVQSRTIAEDIRHWRPNKSTQSPGIGKIGRDLAGLAEKTTGANRTDRPILELTSEDPQTWQLTRYGELLSFVYFESENGHEQLHSYALEPSECKEGKLISDVLERYYDMNTN